MKFKNGKSYYTIRNELKTGDLILFRGGEFVSNYISKIEKYMCGNGEYTHTGIIIMSDSFPIGSPYRFTNKNGEDYTIIPYVFESTQSGFLGDNVNNTLGNSFLGCQLRKFDEVIENYDRDLNTKIAWCKLKEDKRNKIDNNLLFEIFNKYNNVRYALSIIDLLTAAYPKIRWLRKIKFFKRKWQFCSQLVANIYLELGILNNINPSNVLPCDFLPKNNIETYDTDGEIEVLFSEVNKITVLPINKINLVSSNYSNI